MELNLDLVRKYNVAGPRYTSYPPATRFTEEVKWPVLAEELLANNRTERDLSLYFHIPFCQTLCWYCGCTTVITRQQNQSGTYLNYLRKEMSQMAALLNPKRRVVQLHWGGGTPTFLLPEEIRALGQFIRSRFTLADEIEAGVEIDPRRLTREHVAALREVGFNRASLGVQDHNPVVQQAVHRIQPFEQTQQVAHWIREAGFKSLNIDLMYGLPHQTTVSFEKTLNEVLTLRPERLAVFSYAHVPWLKPAQNIFKDALPSAETKLQLLKVTTKKLTSEGYVYIGMDHFARADDDLAAARQSRKLHRNFQGYSTCGGADMYSFGMSSISQTPNVYWQNEKDLATYYAALDAGKSPVARGYVMTEDDKIRRETIMRLMCDLSLDYGEMSCKLGVSFEDYFARELDSLSGLLSDGLIRRTPAGFEVTTEGRFFIRNIAMSFDAYLPKESERRFSRTI